MAVTNDNVDESVHEYFGRILDLISDGIYISDRNGRTLRVNSMYERLTGLKKSSLVGRNVEALTSEYNFDTILNPRIVKSGKPATQVQTDRRGKKLVLNGYPILDESGEVALVVTFVRDVTLMAQLREQILSQRKLIEKYRTNVQYINEESDQRRPLIAHSPVMVALNQQVESVAATDATVLLQGETGVGKDVFARRIHQTSSRVGKPFVKVDCPTIPESLFESELFGYAPGAFSGAHAKGKLGLLEMADKGTLFLDEIGELPHNMQAKLLRVLQDREFMRVGSTKVRKVDVRVVSATNRDLEREVHAKRFRSDLFYRLRVAVLTLPPLRDRQSDIVPLATHFLERYANRYKKKLVFDADTLAAFSTYQWPGNIREIENLIQSLVITNQNGKILPSDLPSNMVGHLSQTCRDTAPFPADPPAPAAPDLGFSDLVGELDNGKRGLKAIMAEIERKILSYALNKHGSHAEVAKRFKIDRSTLFRKLRAQKRS
ncbi:MAG: sigma 54-interacting transcriptional regulator [Desulfosarcinaceae bacterium]|nr:sigma 54-interacting transcriptional regulator [Desulfosarcinaceae bacterium]